MSHKFTEQYTRLGMAIPETTDLIAKAEFIYAAACIKLGIDPADLPDVSRMRDKYKAHSIADYKLMIIRDAITGEREANWDNRQEDKYGSWFWMNKPGFRFYGSYYDGTISDSSGGSRLCSFSEDDHDFFAQECIALWADFMGGKLPA